MTERDDSQASRAIRLFLSSTFQDMHQERERLVKHVFPEIRRRCEERSVSFTEIDLRWGITREQEQRGEVVSICLAEVDGCRPWFIGIIGGRYGWVPDTLPNQLLDKYPWLKETEDISVTEIEIQLGVLRDQQNASRARFYFLNRDPPSSDVERARIERLKSSIRKSGAVVRENIADAEMLANAVRQDLLDMLDTHFPPEDVPDRKSLARQSEWMLRQRCRAFHAHRNEDDMFNQQCRESGGPLLLTGPRGIGRTETLVSWLDRCAPGDLILSCFVGHTIEASGLTTLLEYLNDELGEIVGLTSDTSKDLSALRDVFRQRLALAAATTRLTLMIDGLDHLPDRDGTQQLTWLPDELPGEVDLIFSASSESRVADAAIERGWKQLSVAELHADQRRDVAARFLSHFSKTLSPRQLDRVCDLPQAANPLFLRTLLEELRIIGSFEQFESELDRYASVKDLAGLFQQVLVRIESDLMEIDASLCQKALVTLWASRDGLSEAEIREAVGGNLTPVPSAKWSPLRISLLPYLNERAGLLTFANESFRDAVELRFLPNRDSRITAHLQLADYMQLQNNSPRRLKELPWQLVGAEAWHRLCRLLLDPDFLIDYCQFSWDGFLQLWQLLDQNGFNPRGHYESAADLYDNQPEALAFIALLLEVRGDDTRSLRHQCHVVAELLQSGSARKFQTAQDLLLAGTMFENGKGPDVDAIESDAATGQLGFWGRLHHFMLTSDFDAFWLHHADHGIRLCLTQDWRSVSTPVRKVIRNIVYRTVSGVKSEHLRHEPDGARRYAQYMLKKAGEKVGHGTTEFFGRSSPREKEPTDHEIDIGLKAYDRALEVYADLRDFDAMAFALKQKQSLPRNKKQTERLRDQAKLFLTYTLEQNDRGNHAKAAFLGLSLAMETSNSHELHAAIDAVSDALRYLSNAGESEAVLQCHTILKEARQRLRNGSSDRGIRVAANLDAFTLNEKLDDWEIEYLKAFEDDPEMIAAAGSRLIASAESGSQLAQGLLSQPPVFNCVNDPRIQAVTESIPDPELGERYFLEAVTGHNGYGDLYGVDLREVRRRYEFAAHHRHVPALVMLAEMYFHGEGVEHDQKRAVDLYLDAASHGSLTATAMLAVIQEDELLSAAGWNEYLESHAPDNDDAFLMSDLTDVAGQPGSSELLVALLHAEVKFGPRQPQRVAHWAAIAADRGLPAAMAMMGRINENGIGVAEDIEAAARWYGLAAKGGAAEGSFLLAEFHRLGKGASGADHLSAQRCYIESYALGFDRPDNVISAKAIGRLIRYHSGIEGNVTLLPLDEDPQLASSVSSLVSLQQKKPYQEDHQLELSNTPYFQRKKLSEILVQMGLQLLVFAMIGAITAGIIGLIMALD